MKEKSATKPTASASLVRKRVLLSTPGIVNNKRKHLEKSLSAAKQHDVLC